MNTVAKWSFSLLSLILFSRIKFYCGGEKVDTLVFCGKSIAILLPFITEGASCNWNKNWGGPGTISLFTEKKVRPSPGRLMNVPVSTRERCLPWSIPSALHCLCNGPILNMPSEWVFSSGVQTVILGRLCFGIVGTHLVQWACVIRQPVMPYTLG